MGRRIAALLLLLLVSGSAVAVPVEGTIHLSESLAISGAFGSTLIDGAAFVNGTEQLGEFGLRAVRVEVWSFRNRFLEPQLPGANVGIPLEVEASSYVLNDVAISLASGEHAGWFGVYRGPAALRVVGERSLEIGAATSSRIGNSANDETTPDPRLHAYEHSRTREHLSIVAQGGLHAEGDLEMKIHGLDLRFEAKENRTTVATGIQRSGDAGAQFREERWLFLRIQDGEMQSNGSAQIEAAASATELAWNGMLSSGPAIGELSEHSATYSASTEPFTIRGDLSATAAPAPLAGALGLRLDLAGEMVATSMTRVAVDPATPSFSPGWFAGALAGAVLVVVGAALISRRRQAERRLEVDDLVDLARLANENERYEDALSKLRAARAAAPKSATIAAEMAFALGRLGRTAEALELYEEASALSSDGQADLDAALLLLQEGGDRSRIEALIVRALDRSPILLLELEDVDIGAGSTAIRSAMAKAKRALG